MSDFFYGEQANLFSFYRLPKALFTSRRFEDVSVEAIMEHLGCSNKKAVGLLRELEEKAGLIERRRQGLGRPSLIYVKNFIEASEERFKR